MLGKVSNGTWNPDKPLTVKALLEDHWLPAQKARELRPTTLEQYRNVVDAWIVPNIGGVKAAALTPKIVGGMVETVRTAKSSRGRKGLSPRSAQLAVGVLKSACGWAVENGILGRNPIAGIRRPRSKSTVMQS